MKNNDWKERLNVVYSTNPDFKYESVEEEAVETLDKKQQKLRVNIEKKGRGGKTVTLINGFIGTENDLKELGKLLKSKFVPPLPLLSQKDISLFLFEAPLPIRQAL